MTDNNLPDAELDVMSILWQSGPMTVRELREKLHQQRPMTHAAVSTLLKRLQAKDIVSREKGEVGKAFIFKASVKPAATYRKIVGDLLDRVFAGSGVAMVSSMLDSKTPSIEEIDEMMEMMQELRKKKSEKPKAGSKRKKKIS